MERFPIVAVMGSGVDENGDRARPLGRWLWGLRVHLLTGGGRGVMTAVSEAFHSVPGRRGLVIGILPGEATGQPLDGYPNPWVELPIRTDLPHSGERGTDVRSRNHINALTADLMIVLPGRAGTASEVHLAIVYQTPVAAFVNDPTDIPGLPLEVPICRTLDEVKTFVKATLPLGPQGTT